MDLILLATEATEAAEGGGSGLSSVVVIALIVALAAFAVAYVVVGPGKRKAGATRRGDIPLAMRPYHSDEELETTGLERAMAWGVALSLFSAVFVAAYWVIEPDRINDKMDEFYAESVEEGRGLYQANCATCHGADAGGGSAPNPYDADAPWPAPNLSNIQARYADSEIVTDVPDFITTTIKQGRPGTPMPAWGAAYQGPLNDIQIDSIVDYILAIQNDEVPEPDAQAFEGALGDGEAIYQNNCARCHGDQLQGQVGPQLLNVFERYGWEPGDEQSRAAVEETIRGTLTNGRYVPTGAIMPPFDRVLTDDAMDAVIEYVFSQQETGGPAYGQVGGEPTPAAEGETESEE
jgi:cbb3-type cytochrome c oxidase subunit III